MSLYITNLYFNLARTSGKLAQWLHPHLSTLRWLRSSTTKKTPAKLEGSEFDFDQIRLFFRISPPPPFSLEFFQGLRFLSYFLSPLIPASFIDTAAVILLLPIRFYHAYCQRMRDCRRDESSASGDFNWVLGLSGTVQFRVHFPLLRTPASAVFQNY